MQSDLKQGKSHPPQKSMLRGNGTEIFPIDFDIPPPSSFISKKHKLVDYSSSYSQNQSQSYSSLAGGYAPSIVASTLGIFIIDSMLFEGSWDDLDQDFNENATAGVVDILKKLDNVLFRQVIHNVFNSHIYSDENDATNQFMDDLEECNEMIQESLQWKTIFPHLRICGIQLIASKESPFQHIPIPDRSCSPYFFIPPKNQIDQISKVSINAIHLDRLDFEKLPLDFKECHDKYNTDNMDDRGQRDNTTSNNESLKVAIQLLLASDIQWVIMGLCGRNQGRSGTPTQSHPYHNLKPSSFVFFPILYQGQEPVNFITQQGCETEKQKNPESFTGLGSTNFKDVLVGFQKNKNRDKDRAHDGLFVLEKKELRNNILVLVHSWAQTETTLPSFELVDLVNHCGDVDLYHHHHRSLQALIDCDTDLICGAFTNQSEDGEIEEFFAFDSRDTTPDEGHSPINMIKEDLIHSIFDDLWPEVYPQFNNLAIKLQEGMTSSFVPIDNTFPEMQIKFKGQEQPEDQGLFPRQGEALKQGEEQVCENEQDQDGFDLSSAITIRHIPLKRRGLNTRLLSNVSGNIPANITSNITALSNTIASTNAMNSIRPASAKVNIAGFSGHASLKGNITTARPTSARPKAATTLSLSSSFISNNLNSNSRSRIHTLGLRLIPISSNSIVKHPVQVDTVNNSLNHRGTGSIRHIQVAPRPISARPTTALYKRLPPLALPLPTRITMQRHVAFEAIDLDLCDARPVSASRRPMGFRTRTAATRPQTAANASYSRMIFAQPNRAMNISRSNINSSNTGISLGGASSIYGNGHDMALNGVAFSKTRRPL